MLKNLKSKLLLGVMVVAIMFVGAVALTAKTANAAPQAIVTVADIQYAATVRQGSSGQAALIWQRFLNGYSITAQLVEDGAFGPLSATQARAWQSSKGLVADAVLGPMSRAVAMAQIQSGSPASAFPAGCTSTVGYSSVTGLPCSTITSLPAGCSSTAGYSSVTGLACSQVLSLPAGCSSTAGYSPSTGAKCDGGSVSSNNGPLVGGAGDITTSKTSTGEESEVLTGETTKVLAFKVEAIDSDIAVTNVKISFENEDVTGTPSSPRLNRYASEVSIYMGSTKVGSVDVADFTRETGDIYTKNFALSNAVVREGASNKATFYVQVTALDNIDSDDSSSDDWKVSLTDLRFQDGSGVVMTATPDVTTTNNFNFIELADSGDVKLTASKGTSNPISGGVAISDSTTTDVLMLEFKLKAAGSDMTFDEITVDLASTNASIATILDELILKNGSDELATVSSFDADGADTVSFALDNSFTIDKDATETFRIYASINDSSAVDNGDTLVVSLETPLTSAVNAEDINGDTITTVSGTAAGEYQAFYAEGVTASNFDYDVVTSNNDAETETTSDYTMTFKVTAFGDSFYVPKDGLVATLDTFGGTAISAANIADMTATNATLDTNSWLVNDGDTAIFTVSIVVAAPAIGFHKVVLNTLEYNTVAGAAGTETATDASYTFTPTTSFETSNVYYK